LRLPTSKQFRLSLTACIGNGCSKQTVDVDEVAMVGIGCRLPGKVHGPGELGYFLLAHRDGIIGAQLAVA